MSSNTSPLYQNLDTEFVNLWSLLRSLTQRGFVGRVRVDLGDYSADIFMNGSSPPVVREIDRASGNTAFQEAELHRVVLRSRETPGTISVFEGDAEAVTTTPQPAPAIAADAKDVSELSDISYASPDHDDQRDKQTELSNLASIESFEIPDQFQPAQLVNEEIYPTGSYKDWPAILATTGELLAAIERGAQASDQEFGEVFDDVRLQLADDYNFLDPTSNVFAYADGQASLSHEIPVRDYVSGLSEALRRTINQIAAGERARRVRERIALEMLTVARKRSDVLERSGFQAQLDRIAGTRVI